MSDDRELLELAALNAPSQEPELLRQLYTFLSRVHFERTEDEIKASDFGRKLWKVLANTSTPPNDAAHRELQVELDDAKGVANSAWNQVRLLHDKIAQLQAELAALKAPSQEPVPNIKDGIKRWYINPENGMIVETQRGNWVRYVDAAAQIAELTKMVAAGQSACDEYLEQIAKLEAENTMLKEGL